jgi:WD40 repeat protein
VFTQTFSPDGNALLVSTNVGEPNLNPVENRLFAIPLDLAAPISLRAPPETTRVRFQDRSTGAIHFDAPARDQFEWRDFPTPKLGSALGTPIIGEGLNRGLKGLGLSTSLRKFDFSTGKVQVTEHSLDSRDWETSLGISLSPDGAEIRAWGRKAAAGDLAPGGYGQNWYSSMNLAGQVSAEYFFDTEVCSENFLSFSRRALACVANVDGYRSRLNTLILSADMKTILAELPDVQGVQWLPDDRLVLVEEPRNEIIVMDSTWKVRKVIASFDEPVVLLSVSKSGQKVLFGKAGQVWVMNLDGSQIRQLTDSPTFLGGAIFSPDEKVVLVSGRNRLWPGQPETDTSELWALPSDGERVPVFNGSIKNTSAFQLRMLDQGRPVPANLGLYAWR